MVDGAAHAEHRVFRHRLSPRQADRLVCAAVLVTGAAQVALTTADPVPRVAVSAALVPACALPLLWRRRSPSLTLVLVAAAFTGAAITGRFAAALVGLLSAGYAGALYGPRGLRMIGGAIAAVLLLLSFTAVINPAQQRPLGHVTTVVLLYCVAWVSGEHTRVRRAYLAQLEDRAQRLERQRDEHAAQAAAAERNRIAREVHDVVTHHVSVIAVQAGAARRTASRHPERAVATLALIESTARRALEELRAQLGVLRHADEQPAPRQPSPGLARLDELVTAAQDAGLHLDLRIEGTPVPLGALLELSAYRVVQEALTNAVKHAPHSHVTVLVGYCHDTLQLTVTDDGPGPPDPHTDTDAPGLGLIGMRERVTLAGGCLATGPAHGGGFRVDARLPVPQPAAAAIDAEPGEELA